MSTRKPPRLANWLLNLSGLTRQNPPLTGDLLEEFRAGQSAAWYWRQTLVVILTGLARQARLCRQPLVAYIIAWTAGAVAASVLWWLHAPPQLHGTLAGMAATAALWLFPNALRPPSAQTRP